MKEFRNHVAVAIDGGGIRGVIVTRALAMLEAHLHKSCHEIFRLTAGTSTGSIVSAGIAAGLTAEQMYQLYVQLGATIFKKTWRSFFWPLTRYRYSNKPLIDALRQHISDRKMGDFWKADPKTDVVITTFDLVGNRTRFIKPWKIEYSDWPVVTAVLASSTIPTYFPVVEGRYVDGGVGSYANPCYLAAYELQFCLGWKPEETTLISLGTGRDPHHVSPGEPSRYGVLDWLEPLLGAFMRSADDQQIHLVESFFKKLDFRRFQVDLKEEIPADDVKSIHKLSEYGEQMGRMILNDQYDRALGVKPPRPNWPVPI
jgi:predicted acylesterase/phospholipase RssA